MKTYLRRSCVMGLIFAVIALSVLNGGRQVRAQTPGIVVASTDSTASLDPAQVYDGHGFEIQDNIGEGLMRFKQGTMEAEPGLAIASPDISADGKTYTFSLRDGLKFADGSVITASTFVDSVRRVIRLKGDVSVLVTDYVDSVQAPDETHVVFTLKHAVGFFTSLVALPPYFPVNQKQYPPDKLANVLTAVDGSGPYRLVSYEAGKQAVFEANPFYWDKPPVTSSITVRYFSTSTDMIAALKDGTVDVVWRTIRTADLPSLSGDTAINQYVAPNGRMLYFAFNFKDPVMSDIRVRQALAYMTDRDAIAKAAYGGHAQVIYSQVPSGFPFSVPVFRTKYLSSEGTSQTDKAVALLGDAGYTADKPLLLDLWYPTAHYGDEVQQIVETSKAQFEASGLVKVSLHSQDWVTYHASVTQGKYAFFLYGWFPDYPDVDNYLSPWADSSQAAGQGVYFSNPRMDDLLAQGRGTASHLKRTSIYSQAQDLYATEVVTIPLLVIPEYALFAKNIIGVNQISAAMVLFYSPLGRSG